MTTVARVDIVADLNAEDIRPSARAAGEKAGAELAAGLRKQFDNEMRHTDFDKVLERAFDTRKLEGLFGRITNRANKAFHNVDWKFFDDSLDRLGARIDEHSLKWQNLSHNTRQWSLIIGAVAAGMQDIAVLGSAAGSGLIVLGAAATSTGIGLGVMVAAFKDLGKDVTTLPAGLRDAATAFQALRVPLANLQDFIEVRALGKTTQAWQSLGTTIAGLTPSFGPLADVVGRIVNDFAKNLKPGTDNFDTLASLIRKSAPIFESIAGSAGTLGVALLRAFERSTPYVADFTGWIDKLVSQFSRFTASNEFTVWMDRSRTTLGNLGQLLSATSTLLDELVSAEAVNRTGEFLDNLTRFMPPLTGILNVLGAADPFGLLAQGLADFGQALEPLLPSLASLAASLSGTLSVAISTWADNLSLVSSAIAPVIAGFAEIIANTPEFAIQGITTALFALSTVLLGNKIVGAFANIGVKIRSFGTEAAFAATQSDSFASKVDRGIGRAGMWAGIVAGATAAAFALEAFVQEASGRNADSQQIVATGESIAAAYNKIGKSAFGLSTPLKDVNGALNSLNGSGAVGMLGSLGNAFRVGGAQANQLSQTLGNLDGPLGKLANADLPAATSQFSAWARELGASDSQVLNMINTMPTFKAALEQASLASGQLATDSDLVAAALGRQTPAQREAASSAQANGDALLELQGKSASTGEAVDGLADKIRGFGSATLDTREASRQFEEALDTLTESIAANGTTLDTGTAAGRANEAALDEIAKSTLELSAATLTQTGSQEQANATIASGRGQLIAMLGQLGITGAEAEAYADKLGLIPENVTTAAQVTGIGAAEASLNNLARTRYAAIQAYDAGRGPGRPTNAGQFARGTVATKATYGVFGEAGPEAVVPLDRALSQVDPAVRWLSAIAQGKSGARYASGGMFGNGVSNVVESGAITIHAAEDPRATAIETLDRLTERLVS